VNVSNVIQALTNLASPDIKIFGGWVVTKKNIGSLQMFISETNPPFQVTVSGDPWLQENFSYVRELWTPSVSNLIPPVRWGNLVKDVSSTLDLLGLILQRLK
jgi:hypothetical protein